MNVRTNKVLLAAVVAIPAMSIALWPAVAQPGSGGGKDGQPGNRGPRDRAPGGEGRGPRSEWAEKFKDDVRDHPRLGRALVALHEAKDYLEKPAPGAGDFGGNKDAAIKACDEAIKKLTEAMKFDPKREPGAGGRGEGDKDKRKGEKDGGGSDDKK